MITMDKQYRYRNGQPARVLCVDANSKHPVIALTDDGLTSRFGRDGKFYSDGTESIWDLIEVVPLWTGELWVHPDGEVCQDGFRVRMKDADLIAQGFRKITATEIAP